MSNNKIIPYYKDSVKDLVQQPGEMLPADKFAVFSHDAEQLAESYRSPLKLNKGDKAPLFSLPNAAGNIIALENMLQQGAVVLTFYRGTWCPYCNLELKTYQQILPQIKQTGANLVAVSPMTPDNSVQMKDTNALQFEVLSDEDNKVASLFTTVFNNPQTSIRAMADLGYDYYGFYSDPSTELPVPATFVISRDGIILFANSEGGDYRKRTEPQKILDILSQ